MRLDQLRYLSDLQYSHSISKTAKRFYISQQSLSNNIQQLEKELNVILLERSPFGVVLTKEAETLLTISDPFLREYDSLKNTFALQHQNTKKIRKRMKIYSSSVLLTNLLPEAIAIFSKRHDHIRISLKEISYKQVFPDIIDHKCDLAFLSINDHFFLDQLKKYDKHLFHHHILLNDHLVACVSAHSQLATKEIIEVEDIIKRSFTYLDIVPLKAETNDHSNIALYTSDNIEFHRRALKEMDIISLMPRYVYNNLFDSKAFISKYLEGAKQTIYHAALYPGSTPDPVTKELVDIICALL
ncbi:MAG: LysR family transcriptional regulator [Peptococcaceae bacterium]|nr:LysR family transcriptional regulator [Peptococcaceae bacterium]